MEIVKLDFLIHFTCKNNRNVYFLFIYLTIYLVANGNRLNIVHDILHCENVHVGVQEPSIIIYFYIIFVVVFFFIFLTIQHSAYMYTWLLYGSACVLAR